jgi:hypothetical protein
MSGIRTTGIEMTDSATSELAIVLRQADPGKRDQHYYDEAMRLRDAILGGKVTSARTYWRLHYTADEGPDSWQGGYDTAGEALEALEYQRAVAAQPASWSRPEQWTATRYTRTEAEGDESW